jgi:hypothetical protein
MAVIVGLGFFVVRGCEVQRMTKTGPGGSGNILTDMLKVVGDAFLQGISLTIEEIGERGEKARETTVEAKKEARAVLLDASDMSELEVKAYDLGGTYVRDLRNGNSVSWQFRRYPRKTFYTMDAKETWPLHWTLYGKVRDGRTPIVAEIEGTVKLGWRDGAGTTPLIAIDHVHEHSFFPYSDALYAKEFPAARLAGMLNAAWLAQRGGPKPLIVIDRREVLRKDQQRIAASEDRNKATLLPHKNEQGVLAPRPIEPGPDVVFAAGYGGARYDEKPKTVFDPSSGLTLRFENGPGRDNDAYWMSLHEGEKLIAVLEVGNEQAWRPDVGETRFVFVNRVTRPKIPGNPHIFGEPIGKGELPLARLVPLLNGYRKFTSDEKGAGHFIIADRRDNPVWLQR